MTTEELSKLIIKELSQHHNRNDIITKVCDQSTLTWKEADNLITEVQAQNKRKITARQSPILIILSIGTLLLGVGLLAYNIQFLIGFFQKDTVGQILSLQSSYYKLAGLITGLVMTVGGFYGLWKTLTGLFADS